MDIIGGTKAEDRPVDIQSPEMQAIRGPAASILAQLLGRRGETFEGRISRPGPDLTATVTGAAGDPLAGIPGATPAQLDVADLTPAEAAQLAALGAGEGAGRRGLLDRTLAGGFLPGQEGANPFLRAAIEAAQRPTLEGLEETLSRVLPGRFTQAGQFTQPGGSSPFDRAAAITTRGVTQELGDIATRMSAGAFEAERGRQQEAVQMSQQEVETGLQKLQAQSLPRLIEQLGIDRGLEEFQRRSDQLMQLLNLIMGGTAPVGATASRRRETPGIMGSIANVAGGVSGFFPTTNPKGP